MQGVLLLAALAFVYFWQRDDDDPPPVDDPGFEPAEPVEQDAAMDDDREWQEKPLSG